MPVIEYTLIVPAAGAGSRVGGEVPKPYLEIAGKTILEHTLGQFDTVKMLKQVIVATAGEYFEKTEALRESIPQGADFHVVTGGTERQDSVFNALKVVDPAVGMVAIHDAARPFVKPHEVVLCLEAACQTGAAILGVPVQDTIKQVSDNKRVVATPDRKTLWQAQTPQIFRSELIGKAYRYALRERYAGTDDASLVEFLGEEEVVVVTGSDENFKITWPRDLQMAKWLLEQQ